LGAAAARRARTSASRVAELLLARLLVLGVVTLQPGASSMSSTADRRGGGGHWGASGANGLQGAAAARRTRASGRSEAELLLVRLLALGVVALRQGAGGDLRRPTETEEATREPAAHAKWRMAPTKAPSAHAGRQAA